MVIESLKQFALVRAYGKRSPFAAVPRPPELGLVDFKGKLLFGGENHERRRFARRPTHPPLKPYFSGRIKLCIVPFRPIYQG
jgi:hypothetical protein